MEKGSLIVFSDGVASCTGGGRTLVLFPNAVANSQTALWTGLPLKKVGILFLISFAVCVKCQIQLFYCFFVCERRDLYVVADKIDGIDVYFCSCRWYVAFDASVMIIAWSDVPSIDSMVSPRRTVTCLLAKNYLCSGRCKQCGIEIKGSNNVTIR